MEFCSTEFVSVAINVSRLVITDKTVQLACLLQVKHGCEDLSFPAADDSGNRYLRSEELRLVHT